MLPEGFKTAAVSCGIKSGNQLDLTLVTSSPSASAAGVFTQNRVVAAPVVLSRSRVPGESVQGIVANSGNANACTGEQGDANANRMCARVAQAIGCSADEVLVCSTGIIGEQLPIDRIESGIDAASSQLDSGNGRLELAAKGIMTTDTRPKLCHRKLEVSGTPVTVAGFAKGAAMIGPNMATMLAFVITDAQVAAPALQDQLAKAVDKSFNCISVEGHTSTNDTVLMLANGASGAAVSPDQPEFQDAVASVCSELAISIVADAEGAGHLIVIDVDGADSFTTAKRIAMSVANSALVKTAVFGADPNWGRIVSAAGYAGVDFSPDEVSLWLNGRLLYKHGVPQKHDSRTASAELRDRRDVSIRLQIGKGNGECRFWTSDLTHEYVRLNAEYHT